MKASAKRHYGLLAVILMFIIIHAAPAYAAGAKQYQTYITKQLVSSVGKTKTGSWTIPYNWGLGNWLDSQGVLTAYTADLNRDQKKECLVLYFTKEAVGSGWRNRMHLAVFSDLSGKIRKTADVKLDTVASGTKMDTRVYVKTKGKKKYLVIQNFGGIDGLSCDTYVFHVTAKDKLYLDKLFIDPGYTSAVGLYVSNKKGILKDLSNETYSAGTELFYIDRVFEGASSQTAYRNIMNQYLKSFGLSVSKKQIWKGSYAWMLKKDSTMKILTYMKSKIIRDGSSNTMSITVKDYSKWN